MKTGLVAEDLFAAALGDEVDLAGEGRDVVRARSRGRCGGPGHFEAEGDGVFEDGWGVGEEAAVPEIGAAAFEDVDGFGVGVGAVEVEAEGAGGFVLAVDDDEVGGFEFGGDGVGELARGEDGGEDLQADVGGEQEGEGGGGEPEIGGVGFVVAAEEPVGEGSDEEGDGGEEEGVAEGAHGLGVEVEEVAEGEGVVAGVLFEEGGEVGVGCGWWSVEDEEAGG